jgi:hypothetical protein
MTCWATVSSRLIKTGFYFLLDTLGQVFLDGNFWRMAARPWRPRAPSKNPSAVCERKPKILEMPGVLRDAYPHTHVTLGIPEVGGDCNISKGVEARQRILVEDLHLLLGETSYARSKGCLVLRRQ